VKKTSQAYCGIMDSVVSRVNSSATA
jgi:hypothetical protein